MGLSINDTAPDFEADTTEGRIQFHDWIGDSWAVLFSHPEGLHARLHHRARLHGQAKPEFDRRNVKIIGLSVDAHDRPRAWAKDIEETQGEAPNYPIIGDADFNVVQALRHAPGQRRRATRRRAPRRTTRPSATCSSSARTRRSS